MHIDFSGVVHRLNVPLHEHSKQDLGHSDFQPPLSLGFIKKSLMLLVIQLKSIRLVHVENDPR